jgi:hypothetical protein
MIELSLTALQGFSAILGGVILGYIIGKLIIKEAP